MPYVFADLVKDTTTVAAIGIGSVTNAGAPPVGMRSLASVPLLAVVNNTFDYYLGSGAEWEVGVGTVTGPNTWSRSPQASSNANALVNFSSGAKDFYVTVSAATLGAFLSATSSTTITNKRIAARVLLLSSGSTPTFNTDNYDRVTIAALAVPITSMTTGLTGTPVAGDQLTIDITDNAVARSISWGVSYEDSSIALPITTVASKKLTVYFDWNSTTSKWRCAGYC